MSNITVSSDVDTMLQAANQASIRTSVFNNLTSTSRRSGAESLSPSQSFRPETDDTLASLCVDPSGNLVRGSQEATWSFSRAQLNALTTSKVTLLSANPLISGNDKCLVVEDSHWLIEVDLSKSAQTTPVSLVCEIVNGETQFKVATQITAANLNKVAAHIKTANNGSFGMYSRDVPQLDRISKFQEPMTIRAKGATAGTDFPDNFVSVKLKVKYRLFDKDTF